jgi:hypothetical protein
MMSCPFSMYYKAFFLFSKHRGSLFRQGDPCACDEVQD